MARVARPSQDAVVIIPGIMGSRLRLRETGEDIWGLDPAWYAEAWLRNEPWVQLEVRDSDADEAARVEASGLLDAKAFSPVLQHFLPYTRLSKRVKEVVADDAALLEFAYDWRLSVTYNAGLLVTAMEAHLDAWRANPTSLEAAKTLGDEHDPKLIVVAHSMGGLVFRSALAAFGPERVRTTFTLGTPFAGASKAAVILGTGSGTPIPFPHKRLRRMARTLPGVHDLLPVYRSVIEGEDDDVRALTPSDVALFGGDRDLAAASFAMHEATLGTLLPEHHLFTGAYQPTPTTLRLGPNLVSEEFAYLTNKQGELVRGGDGKLVRDAEAFGDGTVPRNSGRRSGHGWILTQAESHGALANNLDTIQQVASAALGADWAGNEGLGASDIGMALPDLADITTYSSTPGADDPWWVPLQGEAAGAASVTVTEPARSYAPDVRSRGGTFGFRLEPAGTGIHTVMVEAGGTSPLSQSVLVFDSRGQDADPDPTS